MYADVSYISGDGFPALTSSPPMMTEKDSFQPISGEYEQKRINRTNTNQLIFGLLSY